MRNIGLHQGAHGGRVDHVSRDEDGDGIHRGFVHELEARLTQTEGYLVRRGHRGGPERSQHHRWGGHGVRRLERRGERGHQRARPLDRAAQGRRDGVECRVGQAPLELLDHPLLPTIGMLEHRDLVGTELQAVR